MALALLLVAALATSAQPVRADAGPKPTMHFTFEWEAGTPVEIVEGTLLQCREPDCSDGKPLERAGPQHFACNEASCDSLAYGYKDYNQLRIRFADGTVRESNVFEKSYFRARYHVTVTEDELRVKERTPVWLMFVAGTFVMGFIGLMEAGLIVVLALLSRRAKEAAVTFDRARGPFIATWFVAIPATLIGLAIAPSLPISIAVEVALISLYAVARRRRWLPLMTVTLLANLLTQPLLVLGLFASRGNVAYWPLLILLEILVWLIEAAIWHIAGPLGKSGWRKPVWRALLISLILNSVSLSVGLLVAL
jgi:hypothetical protein